MIWAVHVAGLVTFLSGIVVWIKMKETIKIPPIESYS